MKIIYCLDNFYMPASDGTVYSAGQFPYEYYQPYLEAFDEIRIIGRYKKLPEDTKLENLNISSGKRVSFSLMPNINSPIALLKNYFKVRKALKKEVEQADAVIIRAVSDLGWITFQHAKIMGKPVAMEMSACAWDSTWKHGEWYGKLYAPLRYIHDKIITRYADYVLYVSKKFLPERYPTNAVTEYASNVRLHPSSPDILVRKIKRIEHLYNSENDITLGIIGTLNHRLKGIHDAIEAVAKIQNKADKNLKLRILGPGNIIPYKNLAKKYSIESSVFFDGIRRSGNDVLEWLDTIDIYMQPSYQEGVPRATIEAMSRACPVLGSTAGGIPELLPRERLHKPGDVNKLADLILNLVNDPVEQIADASKNFHKASQFYEPILMPKRISFWHNYKDFIAKKP